MSEKELRFAVILVTYNRLECLKIALEKYDQQTRLPKYILVIDNASNDGTEEFLAHWRADATDKYQKIVVHLSENTGGSGGFCRGVEEGLKLDCDFLFLADDDAYAEKDMLENLERGYHGINQKEKVSAICTSVMNGGQYDIIHRCLIKKRATSIKLKYIPKKIYQEVYFQIDTLSFVGAAIKSEVARKIGSPKSEYFIWSDDTEYSLRLQKEGNIYCIPSSVMRHDVEYNHNSSWKDYYSTRNWIDMVRMHFPKRYYVFAVIEKYLKRCSIFSTIFRKRNKAFRAMNLDAIRDAIHYRLGKNEKYMPKKRSQ